MRGGMAFLGMLLMAGAGSCERVAAQELAYNEKAELDGQGNIFVSSEAGKLIWMGNTKHCAEASFAGDRQTVMCVVMQNPEAGTFLPSKQVEIYLKGGQKRVIEPGGPIREWHFRENGKQVALFVGEKVSEGMHLLYDAGSGAVVEKVAEPVEESHLPEWAKSPAQLRDESVPDGAVYAEERTKWIAKVLREIEKIQPGMTREQLLKVFKEEGGLSFRNQRTYVYAECPYIKVDVKFKAVDGDGGEWKEDPQDIIESISRPYLGWSTVD